jgi:hypothetical protein
MDFLNEAFRKINQMSQGGFIWQLKQTNLTLLAGNTTVALPADFDPGKTALLVATTAAPTKTLIPYKPWQEFLNYQHLQVTGPSQFAAWSFYTTYVLGPPTTYAYTLKVAPDEAAPAAGPGTTLQITYHAMNFVPFNVAANVYFPTPDQFDSSICDLAEAEYRRIYGTGGWEQLTTQAMASLQAMIGSYRTDRLDLAGLADIQQQGQEKAGLRQK